MFVRKIMAPNFANFWDKHINTFCGKNYDI